MKFSLASSKTEESCDRAPPADGSKPSRRQWLHARKMETVDAGGIVETNVLRQDAFKA